MRSGLIAGRTSPDSAPCKPSLRQRDHGGTARNGGSALSWLPSNPIGVAIRAGTVGHDEIHGVSPCDRIGNIVTGHRPARIQSDVSALVLAELTHLCLGHFAHRYR